MAEIYPNTRLRVSPFYDSTLKEGVVSFSPYNRMLMPTSYGHKRLEYDRLTQGVALWDVAVERQVDLFGPDAGPLAQMLCVRDLSNLQIGQGKYVPMCNHEGTLINDPVVLRLDTNHYWLSIADNNILLWAQAIAAERKLNVAIHEPDVSPLALQGPKAADVAAALFGDWVRDLKFFWFRDAVVGDIPVKVQRSGYSKQGGFEIYLMDGSRGTALWDMVKEAGKPWDIGPGNPNPSERIEGGMLSFGGDTDDQTNPFEVRLGPYTDLDLPEEVIGIQSLRRIHSQGPRRHQLGFILDGETPHDEHGIWFDLVQDGIKIGSMTNGVWSPKLGRFIGFALVSCQARPGTRAEVMKYGRSFAGTLCDLPFV